MRFNLPRYWNCLQTILFVVCLIKTYRLLAKDLISAVFVPPWTSFDVSETMAMVVLALILAVAAGSLAVDREPRIWQHELKKTYCQMIERQRIYKLEQLDVYCAGKVAFFEDDMVSHNSAVIVSPPPLLIFRDFMFLLKKF